MNDAVANHVLCAADRGPGGRRGSGACRGAYHGGKIGIIRGPEIELVSITPASCR